MRQDVHILRKDLRRLRWWLAAWVILLAARLLVETTGWRLAGDGLAGRLVLEQLSDLLGIVTLLLFALLVAQLVHDEPTVGLDWFWLTRPYDRRALLRAKLGLAGIFFVLLPLVSELVVMSAFDATGLDMFRASSVFLARDLRWTLGLMVFAVLTATLVSYALAILGTAAGLGLVLFGSLAVALLSFEEESAPDPAMGSDPTSAIVATILFLIIALLVIRYQYVQRRRGRAIVLLVIGLAAGIGVSSVWPWPLARARPIDPPEWAEDTGRVTVSVDRSDPPQIGDVPRFGRRSQRSREIQVAAVLTGVPPDYDAQGVFTESTLELAGGPVLRSRQSGGILTMSAPEERIRRLEGALGVRVYPDYGGDQQVVTPVLSVTDEELTRYGSQPGRLSASLLVALLQSWPVGTLPLDEQASLRRGDMHVEIVHMQRRHDGCTLLLRQWEVNSLLSSHAYRQRDYVLRNAARGEALVGDAEHPGRAGHSSLLFGLMLARPQHAGFTVHHFRVEYGRRRPGQAELPRIDSDWLDAAELVIVETVPAGTLTRSITIEDFRMQPAE